MQRMIQPVRLAGQGKPAWRPAMAQNIVVSPMTPPGAPQMQEKGSFIDSAFIGALFGGLGAAASVILAYAAGRKDKKIAYLFGGMAGILAFKTIGDLTQLRER